jgi:hypothetical protein
MVGWTQAGKDACCDTGVILAIEGHRVTFGVQTGNAWQPQSRFFEILAGSTTANVIGDGVDIHKSGSYGSCPNPVGGQCVSLNDVLTYPGVNGELRPFGGAFRENDSATFDSVLVISN